METNHNREAWRGGMVFERGERWLWSRGVESYQTQMKDYKR